jgi:glucose/arabinose dehydrogenase
MKQKQFTFFLLVFFTSSITLFSQLFERTELQTELDVPWEIQYGPDHHLWITDRQGIVARVDTLGNKTIVYQAPDFFWGSEYEYLQSACQKFVISGTLGLALDPRFTESDHSYIYYIYSYNAGSDSVPMTNQKIVQLHWDKELEVATYVRDIFDSIPSGMDHIGGRMMAVVENDTSYLYFTVGDCGVSEFSRPDCFPDQSLNPDNFTQDPSTRNGKTHRIYINGDIPWDNPIPGNSMFTRGHRNPQGMMYVPQTKALYTTEHGDFTDDEINELFPGMNYGFKNVHGYHSDDNFPGEADFVANYQSHPLIANDSLVEPLFSWCAVPKPENVKDNSTWCTVAPSDGIYYGDTTIPSLHNTFIVTTLKTSDLVTSGLYVFHLNEDRKTLRPSTEKHPNPRRLLVEDNPLNGRIRDIAFNHDGTKMYLIGNNFNGQPNRITVYTYTGEADTTIDPEDSTETSVQDVFGTKGSLSLSPNPVVDVLNISTSFEPVSIEIFSVIGEKVLEFSGKYSKIDVRTLPRGVYTISVKGKTINSIVHSTFLKE